MAEIVVCGGSMIGLATAMMLARDGHHVTVLESDPAPVPEVPADAWDRWDRKGVAQFHQPHNLFSRVRQILDEDLRGEVFARPGFMDRVGAFAGEAPAIPGPSRPELLELVG